jgi:diguanylate cyclase (GGDEF)-like protein/PAS domain S-box-containing protein
MKEKLKILILEDSANDAELMERELRDSGISYTAIRTETRESFEAALNDFHPDLILSDYSLPTYNGRIALEFVKTTAPEIPVIMVTGALGEETAVELLNSGVKDYVLKDRLARLPFAIKRVLAEAENAKARRESEMLLRVSEARFRNTLEHAPTGIGVASLDGRFIEVNQSLCRLLGYTREELLQLTFIEITHPDDRARTRDYAKKLLDGEINSHQIEKLYLRKGGQPVWVQVTVSLLQDDSGAPLNFIGQIEDITERKRSQEEIRQLAYYDVLTGLPNRRLLLDRLNQALAQAQRHRRSLAVMFLDLDRFKDVNDTLGHDVGDELLKVVAERLELCVRGGDTVSRQGGDEFVIILSEIAQQQDAALVAEKILEVLSQSVTLHRHKLKITTSIGIAIYTVDSADDTMKLLKKADIAMYQAKEAGRNGFRFFSGTNGISEPETVPSHSQVKD